MTARVEYIRIKYHCFRSKIKRNEIKVKRIQIDHQRADIYTKEYLTRFPFEEKRKLVMGSS